MDSRRLVVAGMVLALALIVCLAPVSLRAQGQNGNSQGVAGSVADLQKKAQALTQQVTELQADLAQLKGNVASGNAALQAEISTFGVQLVLLQAQLGTVTDGLQSQISGLSAGMQGFQDLLNSFNAALNGLQARVLALEERVATLGNGLTSYEQLAGLPCTTANGTAGHVSFMGIFKSPICAGAVSANGRFIDLGLVILDTQMHLMWEKKNQSPGLHFVNGVYSWCEAAGSTNGTCAGNTMNWIGQVNGEAFAGFSDWRLPTQSEMINSFMDTAAPNCGGNGPFPCVQPIFGPAAFGLHWSSENHQFDANFSWMVNSFRVLTTVHPNTANFGPGNGPFVRAVRNSP